MNRQIQVRESLSTTFVAAPWHDLLKPTNPALAEVVDDDGLSETEAILFALASAVEQRDKHIAGHCERLAFISVAMGIAMGLGRPALLALYRGGYLHDIGKIGLPDSILFKKTQLSAEEWIVMRSHPSRGEEICRHLKSLAPVLPIIRHHHERFDGSGYPDGLRFTQVPLLARVLQVADIYDALTNARPYKPAYSAQAALGILEHETKRGWRDPEIVKLFFTLHDSIIARDAQLIAAANCDLDAIRRAVDSGATEPPKL